jgi:hypothetical protein
MLKLQLIEGNEGNGEDEAGALGNTSIRQLAIGNPLWVGSGKSRIAIGSWLGKPLAG